MAINNVGREQLDKEGQIVLKYVRGRERDVVIEEAGFDKSIFTDQYVQALKLVNSLIDDDENSSLKCVAFCGDRGEGKTSCMSTVRHILEYCDDEKDLRNKFVKNLNLTKLEGKKFYEVEVIDPSFFDEKNNILEVVISHLYNESLKRANGNTDCRLNLNKAFSDVNSSLKTLETGDLDSLNDLHRLSVMSTRITLRKQMEELVEKFLKFVGCDYLVIPIDDIDLHISYAYRMCEQIRKYLCVKHCLVFFSVKISQLQDVVASEMKSALKAVDTNSPKQDIFNVEEISAMAEKYVNKLIPARNRINMPKAYSMIDFKLDINGEIYTESVKDVIVQLIYTCTRYMFYNSYDNVSPIVPNNLRDLQNLIAFLSSLDMIDNSRSAEEKPILEKNKRLFKSYFFSVWRNRFNTPLRDKLDALINFDFGTSFNKEVVSIIAEYFKNNLAKDYLSNGEEEYEADAKTNVKSEGNTVQTSVGKEMINSILSTNNFGYNITIGDVFYLLTSLESETLNESLYALVFFLKSIYSIKLYETYDLITEKPGMIYPKEDKERAGLMLVDRRFDQSNRLQQLTGGSYFTYRPGEYIPYNSQNQQDNKPNDLRVINGKALNDLLSKLKREYPKIIEIKDKEKLEPEEKEKLDQFIQKLKVAEFFILTIKAAIPQKQIGTGDRENLIKVSDYLRKNVDAWHYRGFYPNTGYYLFDIMAPFGTMLNVEFTYRRFAAVDDEFFSFIKNFEGSILYSIFEECKDSREYIMGTESDFVQQHKVLSDCSIRNAEVLMSIIDFITHNRKLTHTGGKNLFNTFYQEILDSKMKTQKNLKNGKAYNITFSFLEPLKRILDQRIAITKKRNDKNKEKKGGNDKMTDLDRLFEKTFSSIFELNFKTKTDITKSELIEELKLSIGGAHTKNSIYKRIIVVLKSHNLDWDKEVLRNVIPNYNKSKGLNEDELNVLINTIYPYIGHPIVSTKHADAEKSKGKDGETRNSSDTSNTNEQRTENPTQESSNSEAGTESADISSNNEDE